MNTNNPTEVSDEEFEAFLEGLTNPKPLSLADQLLHTLQFTVLPEAAFTNHPELIRELETPRLSFNLLHFRSKTLHRCGRGETDETPESEERLMADMKLFGDLKISTHRRGGYSVHVITMPESVSPGAYYAGILFKDDEAKVHFETAPSTRYYTLEKGIGSRAMLCESRPDGMHGTIRETQNDPGLFVESIFEREGIAP